jgi:hypothetical protein
MKYLRTFLVLVAKRMADKTNWVFGFVGFVAWALGTSVPFEPGIRVGAVLLVFLFYCCYAV